MEWDRTYYLSSIAQCHQIHVRVSHGFFIKYFAPYRALAKKYHPDANPKDEDAAERMNRINAAYAMLRGGSADLFLEEDWFREQADDSPRRSILYHPTFRRVIEIVILIAASMAAVAILSAFFSGLWPY